MTVVLMALVEDEEGTAVLLRLCRQPEELVVSTKAILKRGSICLLKEPFFKRATDGSYALRIDHVSDIIWLDGADERIPLKWKTSALNANNNSESIRALSDDALKNRNWAEAQRL
jgi:hypothetical protein